MSTPARKEGAKRGSKRNARSTSVATNGSTDLLVESLCTHTSPIKRARVQEEYELGDLNNRLVDCINIVKRLENDKSQLEIKIQGIENKISRSEAGFNEKTSQLDDLKSKAEIGKQLQRTDKLQASRQGIDNMYRSQLNEANVAVKHARENSAKATEKAARLKIRLPELSANIHFVSLEIASVITDDLSNQQDLNASHRS
uniref:CCDC158 n=1 Tax=Strongyloides papillosus TaxID=174720 RepID=A0A0N5BB72_STREA